MSEPLLRWLPGGGGAPDTWRPRPDKGAYSHLRSDLGPEEDDTLALPWAVSASAELLRRAAPERLRLPLEVRVAALARVARSWLDPCDPSRKEAIAVLPGELGFTEEVVEFGLDQAFAVVTAEALTAWWERDAPTSPVGLTGHLWAGNVFVAGLPPVFASLLAGVPALIKAPSRFPSFAALFARSLALHAPELGPCVGAAAWSRTQRASTRALLTADRVFAFGDDSSIEALRADCPDLRGFGHKVSFALVDGPEVSESTLQGLARDALAFDGQGCLTPRWVLVPGELADACRLAARAAEALARTDLPARPLEDGAAARRAQYLGVAGFSGAAFVGSGWYASAQPGLAPDPPPRGLCFVPVPSWEAVPAVLAPLGPRLQGCAVEGVLPERLEAELRALGLSRSCPPGELQRPPLDWDHDGVAVLRSVGTDEGPG